MTGLCDLGGRGVLVTRPAAQAQELCRLIEELGGRPIAFPTVEIRPPRDSELACRLLSVPYDLIIFISRNAVDYALALAPDKTLLTGISDVAGARPQRAAVGRATATAMQQAGLAPDLVPEMGFDTESLMAMPALMQVAGKRVLIVRGEGGRALLGETLAHRGAEVTYAEVYRRAAPETNAVELLADWKQSLGFVTATSEEILMNLLAMVPKSAHRWLRGLPLAVFGKRNAGTAMELGFRVVAVAHEASDAALCDALCRLHLNASSQP
ncbi:MAG: uroporphyrinogen-III synthase [Thiohalocapsa sp. PB-PSB1]|jgi:uroporphyrinogen-III synthase|nr:MAG: uroporphyrinogen-III synthase [Thiohalocapsa sp. PB-PSB1]HCS91752.1 uroporphyrinogen III synthase [Chromatiaceae bacterium]